MTVHNVFSLASLISGAAFILALIMVTAGLMLASQNENLPGYQKLLSITITVMCLCILGMIITG